MERDTGEDYRKMNAYLKNVEFHTFDLWSEKSLKVVLKGILQEITEHKKVKEDLESMKYKVGKQPGWRGEMDYSQWFLST